MTWQDPNDIPTIDASMLESDTDFEKGMSPFPLVSVVLAVVCTAFFTCQLLRGGLDDLDKLIAMGALDARPVAQGEVWRLVSALFLHGGIDHLIGNLLILYVLGMAAEHCFGRPQFLILYLAAGIVGSLFSLTAGRTSVGASGAIFGLAGALVAFFWRHGQQFPLRDKRIGFVLAIWAVYQILLGFLSPEIDNLAHVGGLVGGAALGLLLPPALVHGRAEVAHSPATYCGLAAAVSILLGTAIFFIPRVMP